MHEVQEEPFKIHPSSRGPRRRRHSRPDRFRPGRFRPYVYPIYQPVYYPVYQPVHTQQSEDEHCVTTYHNCQDKFEKQYGSFNTESCNKVIVQKFAKSLDKYCNPIKENYSTGNWSVGVL